MISRNRANCSYLYGALLCPSCQAVPSFFRNIDKVLSILRHFGPDHACPAVYKLAFTMPAYAGPKRRDAACKSGSPLPRLRRHTALHTACINALFQNLSRGILSAAPFSARDSGKRRTGSHRCK